MVSYTQYVMLMGPVSIVLLFVVVVVLVVFFFLFLK